MQPRFIRSLLPRLPVSARWACSGVTRPLQRLHSTATASWRSYATSPSSEPISSSSATSEPSTTEQSTETWAPIELTPAQYTLASRLHLHEDALPNALLLQSLTHASHLHASLPTHDRLEHLGRKVLGLLVTEHLHVKYPVAPIQVLRDAMEALVGSRALTQWGYEVGMDKAMLWKPAVKDEVLATRPDVAKKAGEQKVQAKCVLALLGAIYHHRGLAPTREFIREWFLSRDVDMHAMYVIQHPKRALAALLRRKGMEPPVSRLLREVGRASNAPVFVVGVYTGEVKLAEAPGVSIKQAEHRAAKTALREYYLSELKDVEVPSRVESLEDITFYQPAPVGDTPAVL